MNKYADAAKAPAIDPLEVTVATSRQYEDEQDAIRRRKFGDWDEDEGGDEHDAEAEAAEEAAYLAEEEALRLAAEIEGEASTKEGEQRREPPRPARGQAERKSFPDNARIDPYDPTTFGFVYLGAVLGAHGLSGEMKVRVLSDFPHERLKAGAKVHLKEPRRRFPKEYRVVGGRPAGGAQSNSWLVKLKGVRSREDAATLQGHTFFVWRDDRSQALARGEFLVENLVGLKAMRAISDESSVVGTVVGVVTRDEVCTLDDVTLGHDLLEIAVPGGRQRGAPRTCLVPFVPALVAAVDVARGVLWLDDGDAEGAVLTGLLELAIEPPDRTRIRATMPERALSLQQRSPPGSGDD